MSDFTLDLPDLVFAKTMRGRAEVVHRAAGLNVKQRSLLIMIDGRTPVRDLPLPPAEVERILERLVELDLVAAQDESVARRLAALTADTAPGQLPHADAVGVAGAQGGSSPGGGSAEPAPFDTDFERIQSLMVDSAQACLGLMAAEVIRRIGQARSASDLQAVAGHWHMAMCESKRGRELGSEAIAEVKRALKHPVGRAG